MTTRAVPSPLDGSSSADPLALTQALVRISSVTPHSGAAVGYVADLLSQAGYHVDRLTFATGGVPIHNLYAWIGSADGPNLCFAGHVDVVPQGDEAGWRHPPFAGVVEQGMLYGRGAVDMKGGVGAALAAALRHGRPDHGRLSFLITGDEEGPALDGTVQVVAWLREQGARIDHCVLGEPTNPQAMGDMVKIGRRGSLSGLITVTGRQGHVAYPHLADNPVPKLVRLLNALIADPLDMGTAHFERSNLEIVSIDVGNSAFNVIPETATARFNVRFNDTFTLEGLKDEIRRRLAATSADIDYDLRFQPGASASFLTAPGPFVDLVVSAIAEVTGRTPRLSTSGGTSDARFIKDLCPVVEFGLVGRTMHAVNEATPVADLDTLARIYQRLIARYFACPPLDPQET